MEAKRIDSRFLFPIYEISEENEIRSSFEKLYIDILISCGFTKEEPLEFSKPIPVNHYLDLPGYVDVRCCEIKAIWYERPERFDEEPVIAYSAEDEPYNEFLDLYDGSVGEEGHFTDLTELKQAILDEAEVMKGNFISKISKLLLSKVQTRGAIIFHTPVEVNFLNSDLQKESVLLLDASNEVNEWGDPAYPVVKYVSSGKIFTDQLKDLYLPDVEGVYNAILAECQQERANE